MSIPCRIYLGLVGFSLAGSLASRLTGLDPGWIAPIAAALTLAFGAFAAMSACVDGLEPRARWALVAVLAVGASSEILGVYTGLPFGDYAYTRAWWPTVTLPGGHPYPLLLPLAWAMMVCSAYAVCTRFGRWAVLAGALLAALADVPMEPVMAGPLGYWEWLEPGPMPGGAPILNFVGWFATAFVAGWVLRRAGVEEVKRPEPAIVLGTHVAFTVLIGLILS